ncbi:CHASE2 domain-containing protein, partial [Acinetobacter baumannii]
LVLLVYFTTDLIQSLERKAYDLAVSFSGKTPYSDLAVIAVDDRSISNIGRWPWSRDVHAKLIDKLNKAGAKQIVETVFFFEPQADQGL